MCIYITEITCPRSGLLESHNTDISFNRDQVGYGYPIGTRVTYSCDQGYERTSGWEVRTCQASGEWNGYAGICTKSNDKHSYNRLYNLS